MRRDGLWTFWTHCAEHGSRFSASSGVLRGRSRSQNGLLAYEMHAMLAYCRVAPDEPHLVKWKRSFAFCRVVFREGILQLAYCGVAPAQLAYCRVAPDVT